MKRDKAFQLYGLSTMFHLPPSSTSIKFIEEAGQAILLIKKIHMARSHIWFNSTCLQMKVIPKYMLKSATQSTSEVNAVEKAKHLGLRADSPYDALIVRNICIYRLSECLFQKCDQAFPL